MAKHPVLGHSPVGAETPRLAAKRSPVDDTRYWKTRLFHPTYTRDGERHHVPELAVRIAKGGRRHCFNLHTANKEKAARLAAELHAYVIAHPWDDALAKYGRAKLDAKIAAAKVTVSQYLAAAEGVFERKEKTFKLYASYLRKIVADICHIDGGKERFDYRAGGRDRWLGRVDAVRLADITAAKLQAWKVAFMKRALDPAARKSAERSANSYLRCARSLFSPKIVGFVAEKIELPNPLPFATLKLSKPSPAKYASRIDAPALIAAARRELRDADADAYAVFLLAIGAGLRKAEIDTLRWDQIDFGRNIIQLAVTEHAELKSDESAAEVEIDPALATELRHHMASSRSAFVIGSPRRHRDNVGGQYYRAEPTFERLYAWLRAKGVVDRKPLHVLRKEFGSMLNARFGLYAASAALRHRDIQTTAGHYVSNRGRIALEFGDLLTEPMIRAVPAPETRIA